ncbi:MAG TPA: hypothetical protein VMZ92_10990 [Planctomycetota bacterium]|nr:hypothetical protein [Planctomycetota bacterium]
MFLVVGGLGIRQFHQRKLEGLFAGSPETPAELPGGTCPRIAYDLKYWLGEVDYENETAPASLEAGRPKAEANPWAYVDGAERERFEAMMRRSPRADAATGATRLVRLQSPTVYRETWLPRSCTITSPVDGALFPSNLCSPFVEWSDTHNDLWQVTVSAPSNSLRWTGLSREHRWRVPGSVWEKIRGLPAGTTVQVQVRGVKRAGLWGTARSTVHVSRPVSLSISPDPADAAIVYRLVDPPFVSYKTPNMYVREIGEKEARPFLLSRRRYCFNCHTFSRQSAGGKVGLQVRYMGETRSDLRVYFAVHHIGTRRTEKIALPFKIQMTTFMAWSPDETKLAFSANQAIVTLPPLVHETQYAGLPTSDIAVYDTTRNEAYLLPGASAEDVIEVYPRWTPDGKSIVYCRASAGAHPALVKLALHVIRFDDGRGGTGRAIPGAQAPDKSSYYPRFSPDGRWFTFVRSDGGSLIKSSSDVWIMPGSLEGEARPLESNVPFAADSWHSWSSNSRWIVFASKRDDGVFARLYMTHIDDEGHASPAVRLPVTDPPMMSFNIPEFVTGVPAIRERTLYDGLDIENEAVHVGRRDGN